MRRFLVICLVLSLSAAACSVTHSELRLDMLEIEGLPADDVVAETEAIRERVSELWGGLRKAKLTTSLTKKRIAPFFESEQELSDFIAIYASLFRENRFWREYVHDFEIGEIVIEPNGALARVEVTIWGKIYSIWRHKIHEVQLWKKVDGEWVIKPLTY